MPHSVYIEYKGHRVGVLNIELREDGSAYFFNLITRQLEEPEFAFFTYDFPAGLRQARIRVMPDPVMYVTTGNPKFSYHPRDRVLQVSGDGVFSRINRDTKEPMGLGAKIFDFNVPHNDGGPIVTGKFWGLSHLDYMPPKTSEEIVFDEEKVRYQSMGDNKGGSAPAFAVLVFQLTEDKIRLDQEGGDWGFYDYTEKYRKPLWVRVLRNPHADGYVLAISVLGARSDSDSDIGFHLVGGSTIVDPQTGTSKDIALIFPRPNISDRFSEVSLDFPKKG